MSAFFDYDTAKSRGEKNRWALEKQKKKESKVRYQKLRAKQHRRERESKFALGDVPRVKQSIESFMPKAVPMTREERLEINKIFDNKVAKKVEVTQSPIAVGFYDAIETAGWEEFVVLIEEEAVVEPVSPVSEESDESFGDWMSVEVFEGDWLEL